MFPRRLNKYSKWSIKNTKRNINIGIEIRRTTMSTGKRRSTRNQDPTTNTNLGRKNRKPDAVSDK